MNRIMAERLQKLIAQAGLASRREAEQWISAGRVQLNGRPAVLGERADPARDRILVDGHPLAQAASEVTVLLNKPRGYLTSLRDPQGRRLVTELVRDIPQRLFPVGRLDYNTEGLLLLTNDGELAQRISHPRHHVAKTYLVKARGRLSSEAVARLEQGIELADGLTAPARVTRVRRKGEGCWFEMTLYEGRNRQVRRMVEAVGLTVVRLKRVRLGFLDLEGVAPGHYRRLEDEETRRLKKIK